MREEVSDGKEEADGLPPEAALVAFAVSPAQAVVQGGDRFFNGIGTGLLLNNRIALISYHISPCQSMYFWQSDKKEPKKPCFRVDAGQGKIGYGEVQKKAVDLQVASDQYGSDIERE